MSLPCQPLTQRLDKEACRLNWKIINRFLLPQETLSVSIGVNILVTEELIEYIENLNWKKINRLPQVYNLVVEAD